MLQFEQVMTMDSLGSRIKVLREDKKMKQEDLAKALNISKSAVGMYERNERRPDYDTLQKIANYFDVSRPYLLGDSKDPHNEENGKTKENQTYIKGIPLTDEEVEKYDDLLDWIIKEKLANYKKEE